MTTALAGRGFLGGTRAAQLFKRLLRGGDLTPGRKAASVALGLFVGSQPVYGLHFVLCAALCLPLRLDLVLAYVAANISNPIVAPFLIAAEIEIGSWILTGQAVAFDVERARATGVTGFIKHAVVGALFVGCALSVLGAALTLSLTKKGTSGPSEPEYLLSIRNTIQRFSEAPIRDRQYVAHKLVRDPITRQLPELPFEFGRTLDLGSGRGQLALYLIELGKARPLAGVDWDARKVSIANRAARGSATFWPDDILKASLDGYDTILMIDVLHYLPKNQVAALFSRAARALGPGGRMILRDVDKSAGLRAKWTMLFERLAVALRYNLGERLEFYSSAELMKQLTELGFECRVAPGPDGALLANTLIVAEKPDYSLKDTSTSE